MASKVKTTKVSAEELVAMAGNVTRTIGEAEAGLCLLQVSTEKAIQEQLVSLKNAGFTSDMLKSKHACRIEMEKQLLIAYVRGRCVEYNDYYKATVAKKESPETPDAHWFKAMKLPEISIPDSTRYNRFSAIRNWFDSNTGKKVVPLDLYGNLARKAQATNAKRKAAGKSTRGDTDPEGAKDAAGKPVTNEVRPQMKGLAPLQKFVAAWIDENQSVAGLKKYMEPLQQLLRTIETDMPKKA